MRQLLLILTLLATLPTLSQNHEILSDNIRTLQVVANNRWTEMPIISLSHPGEYINIDFDELSHDYHRYTYHVSHCDANWNVDEGLFENEYLSGFNDERIEDFEYSINTNTLYTHYHISLPNEKTRIKMSGNYAVTITDDDSGEAVLTARFHVCENTMGCSMKTRTDTDFDIRGRHQQIEMELSFGDIKVTDPTRQIKTTVIQNGNTATAVRNSPWQYTSINGLKWEHCKQLVFNGGNEYRRFEVLDVDHPTLGIDHMAWDGTNVNAFLFLDEPRLNYIYDEDTNGSFFIRNSDNTETNTTTDYVIVHFSLKTGEKLNGNIYISGDWTYGLLTEEYKLKWNEESKTYTAAIPLKQGYYSYKYLFIPYYSNNRIDEVPTEGSFYETENQYTSLVYFKGPTDRTDRLVAVGKTY